MIFFFLKGEAFSCVMTIEVLLYHNIKNGHNFFLLAPDLTFSYD